MESQLVESMYADTEEGANALRYARVFITPSENEDDVKPLASRTKVYVQDEYGKWVRLQYVQTANMFVSAVGLQHIDTYRLIEYPKSLVFYERFNLYDISIEE